MKIFISWSGERSLAIAKALRDWLPRVIQAVEPWMSETDADKGTRWEQEIAAELAQTKFGIVCLTPENLDARWINFEAGAISKTVEKTYVCTYIHDLKSTDIEGPLSKFNHTRTDKDDTWKLIKTVNRALELQSIKESIVLDAFELYWPRLEEAFKKLPSPNRNSKPVRPLEDMVEELLDLVRGESKERARNVQITDKLLTSYLPMLETAFGNNPNLMLSPEMSQSLYEFKRNADRLLHSKKRYAWPEPSSVYVIGSNIEFVDEMFDRYRVFPPESFRAALIYDLDSGRESRPSALQKIEEFVKGIKEVVPSKNTSSKSNKRRKAKLK